MAKSSEKSQQNIQLVPKAKANLDQLSKDSGMTKSEVINKLLIDYHDSIQKKICV